MLKSMTGFGAAQKEDESYKITVEIKAVNQRFLEVAFHMAHPLYPYEDLLRREIRKVVSRGKVDVFLTCEDKRHKSRAVEVDRELALAYHQALAELSDFLHLARPDEVMKIAAYPDVIRVREEAELKGAEAPLLQAMAAALAPFDAMRQAEGRHIEADFLARIDNLEAAVTHLRELAPGIVAAYRQRLQETISGLLGAMDHEIDETRLIQETAIYADKVNYTEEVVRLGSHFSQFRTMVEQAQGPVGRKLDFLIQEMNRETNTIASKANSTEAAQLVVDMKSEIEKLREQVQNIE